MAILKTLKKVKQFDKLDGYKNGWMNGHIG
jgi:hypothetical protein